MRDVPESMFGFDVVQLTNELSRPHVERRGRPGAVGSKVVTVLHASLLKVLFLVRFLRNGNVNGITLDCVLRRIADKVRGLQNSRVSTAENKDSISQTEKKPDFERCALEPPHSTSYYAQ